MFDSFEVCHFAAIQVYEDGSHVLMEWFYDIPSALAWISEQPKSDVYTWFVGEF